MVFLFLLCSSIPQLAPKRRFHNLEAVLSRLGVNRCSRAAQHFELFLREEKIVGLRNFLMIQIFLENGHIEYLPQGKITRCKV